MICSILSLKQNRDAKLRKDNRIKTKNINWDSNVAKSLEILHVLFKELKRKISSFVIE